MNIAEVIFDDVPIKPGTLGLKPGVNLQTGESYLEADFGKLTSLETDFLTTASSIFASDLAFKRGERENITRKIKLTIPVVNRALFEAVKEEIRYALLTLSHDAWEIEFTQLDGEPEVSKKWANDNDTKVLLFSGGLDSFTAAMELGYKKANVHLVSHLTGNQNISSCQNTLFEHIQKQFKNQFHRTGVRVRGIDKTEKGYPFPSDAEREETQRTRSFLFLTLASIVARRLSAKDVIMIAENGQLAIHLPLTTARIGAFSTHTAHPDFIQSMEKIIKSLLSFKINIENPFLYLTKAEVVQKIHYPDRTAIPLTVSCWMSARLNGGHSHCGECVPCLVRRIANEVNGIKLPEYKRDILSEDIIDLDPNDKGKRNFVELAEFVQLFSTRSQAEIIRHYPELYATSFDANKVIEMYRRFAAEAISVFQKYPNLTSILG